MEYSACRPGDKYGKSPAAEWVGEIAEADGIDPRTTRSVGDTQSLARRIEQFNSWDGGIPTRHDRTPNRKSRPSICTSKAYAIRLDSNNGGEYGDALTQIDSP